MYTMRPVGFVRNPYAEAAQVPKGCGARHDAEGAIEVLPEFADGLLDIEGFSHLFVIRVLDRAEACRLLRGAP